MVQVDLITDWGDPVHVELQHERYRTLGLQRDDTVFVIPKERKVFTEPQRQFGDSISKAPIRGETPMKTLFNKARPNILDQKVPGKFVVRLLEPVPTAATTPIERLAIAALQCEGVLSLESLVRQVAFDLYHEELRNGAGVLDIGFYGSGLFVSEVAREIQARSGTLWKIEKIEHS